MTMRRILTAVILLVAGAVHAQDGERILAFNSDITVHADGSMTVRETIRVRTRRQLIKRGIYRDFPTTYHGKSGNRIVVGFDVQEVLRDGAPEPYHTKALRNGVRLYVGREDYILHDSDYTYTIVYRTTHQLGYFDSHDELYWNVTGNGWDFPIDSATATIHLPEGIAAEDMTIEGYTGIAREKGADYTADVEAPGRARIAATRPFGPREGMTVVVTFPKGFVSKPSTAAAVQIRAASRLGDIVAVAGVLIVIAFYFLMWRMVGVDPLKGKILPREQPPEGLSPQAVRYIRRMGLDPKGFSVTLINMAVKNYLRIEQETKREYWVVRSDGDATALTPEEYAVAQRLFREHDAVKLDDSNHATIGGAQRALLESLSQEYRGTYFRRNGHIVLLGLFASAVTVAAAVVSASQFSGPLSWPGVAALVVLLPVNFLFGSLLKAHTYEGRRVADEAECFRMFLAGDGMTRFSSQANAAELGRRFETYLPYAIALDVADEWSADFTRALSGASRSQDTATYVPVWYHGSDWDTLGAQGFASSLGSTFSSAVASSTTAPGSSSGSGGGGFSGGGGGGGGGGGW